MVSFIGRSGDKALFIEEDLAVIVDTRVSVVVASGATSEIKDALPWGDGEFSATDLTVAQVAIDSLSEPIPDHTGKLYTIPRRVQMTARAALQAYSGRAETLSPVSVSIGTLLAKGGQVDMSVLANISNFLEATPVVASVIDDSLDVNPLRELRGGDAAQKWATTIVSRERVFTAPPSVSALVSILEENPEAGPEFIVRISKEDGGISRLYRVDIDGRTYVWDRNGWDDMGQTTWTIWDYDKALDIAGDYSNGLHIHIDPESAIKIASQFAASSEAVFIEDLDIIEAALVRDAIPEIDIELIDSSLTAAGTAGDGIYTEDERSENASGQVRDVTGRFAKMGQQMVNPQNLDVSGKITDIDAASGVATLTDADGKVTQARVSDLTPGLPPEGHVPGGAAEVPRVDFSGILGEPRTPINRVGAQIPGTLPQMTTGELHKVIADFPAWVKSQREGFSPVGGTKSVGVQAKDSLNRGSAGRKMEAESGDTLTTDAYSHPLLKRWLDRKDNQGNFENRLWYKPITAAAGGAMSPKTSDVQPLYMAVVSPDDPRAVFQLISLVPVSAESTAPMVYTREEGDWVKDVQTLNALKSATPPPVVPLDDENLDAVLNQVDDAQGVEGETEEEESFEIDDSDFVEDETTPDPAVADEEPAPPVTASAVPYDFGLMVLWGPRKDIIASVVAAGGADRNRGGAENLRKYWTVGPGGAKIIWNTPGDWTRCVRHLSKYMGPRAKGYCALRHKEMTGMWTGDSEHTQALSSNVIGINSVDVIQPYEAVIASAALRSRSAAVRARVAGLKTHSASEYDTETAEGLTAASGAYDTSQDVGAPFFIPMVLPEDTESGDGRSTDMYAISRRDLPMSLLWQIETNPGHNRSVVVGRIERMGRVPGGYGAAYGYFDTGVYGREAERMVRNGMLRFVSADMDMFEASKGADSEASEDDDSVKNEKLRITSARVMAVTIVAKPAFQECTIQLVPEALPEVDVIPDGVYVEETNPLETEALLAAGYVAESIPLAPPTGWFSNPELTAPTPLTIDDSGRVFGHIASWDTVHTNPQLSNVRPPRSSSDYAYFNKGLVRTEEGEDITVGQLTLVGGHAGLNASARDAARHYDDTASAVADVHAGEDNYGIWVAGSLRPTVEPTQIRALRASTPSGDWRPIRGRLELIAVCQVNSPGFPIARAMVASGHVTALVAAGAAPLALLREDPMADMSSRLEALEHFTTQALTKKAEEVKARVAPVFAARNAELASRSEAVFERMSSFGYVPKSVREQAAEKGQALADGSFSIRDASELPGAIKALGRAKEADRATARRHIVKRARALGQIDMLPENWNTEQSMALTASVDNMRSIIEQRRAEFASGALTEEEELLKAEGKAVPGEKIGAEIDEETGLPKYKPGHQPRDYNGQFRDILARLKEDLGVTGNQAVVEKMKEVDARTATGDYAESVKSGMDLKSLLDRLDSGALDSDALENVRKTSSELGSVIANLPLPFGADAAKIRFSDIPPNLRDLMEDFTSRVTDKIGAEDGAEATSKLRGFMSGSDLFSQAEISSEMYKMLRLLT